MLENNLVIVHWRFVFTIIYLTFDGCYVLHHLQVPTLQRFIQNRRSQLQQHPDFHITSSTFLASTLHITRLNTRNPALVNPDMVSGPGVRSGSNPAAPSNGVEAPGFHERSGNENPVRNPLQVPGQADLNQVENGPNPGAMNSFSSHTDDRAPLLWSTTSPAAVIDYETRRRDWRWDMPPRPMTRRATHTDDDEETTPLTASIMVLQFRWQYLFNSGFCWRLRKILINDMRIERTYSITCSLVEVV